MITIDHKPNMIQCTIEDLTGNNWKPERSAFIGQVGKGPPDEIYLVTYTGIVLLKTPCETWSNLASVIVDRFVNLHIEVLE